MRKILLICALLLSLSVVSQSTTKTYSKIYLNESMDEHFSNYFKKYTAKYFYGKTGKRRIIERDQVLDTVAAGRSEYSMLVFKESSKNTSFSELLDHIPYGARAHKRLYDNPKVFREPKGCIFPDKNNLPILKKNNLVWSSELFIQCSYSFKSENSSMENKEVLKKYLNYSEKKGDFSNCDKFLNGYLNSPDHKNAIHEYGNWKFGSSTMFIISKKYETLSGMWKYEVLCCHTIIMIKNPTDSNVY
jgi:hypothetical protein